MGVDVTMDPAVSCADLYTVVFENDRVRVLQYSDLPGDRTTVHRHPDSVMITLASFTRRVSAGGRQVEVQLEPHQVRWVSAQEHAGENIGDTPSLAFFVELKEGAAEAGLSSSLGPDAP